MVTLNTSNLERQGKTKKDIQLESTLNVRESIISITESALRSIKIFSPDLEEKSYDNDQFREALLNFIRGNRHANIQILTTSASIAIEQGHILIRLAQQLTSTIKIKNIPEDYQETNASFILIDQSNFILKADHLKNKAMHINCQKRANMLLEFFTPAWDQAEIDLEFRSLNI